MNRNLGGEIMEKIEVQFTPDEATAIMRYVSVLRKVRKVLNEKSSALPVDRNEITLTHDEKIM